VLDPRDGAIKAWVGGADFTYSQNDHVRIGTKRQVGSTMKPFLYAAAMDKGLTPESTVPYSCPQIPGDAEWCPKGTGKWAEGSLVSLREGLKASDNLIAAQVMKEVGAAAVVALAKRCNITSHLDEVPALALGVSDISVIEMAGAYTAFANRGIYSKPYYITRITDKDGHVLDEFFPQRSNVLSEKTVYQVVSMMRGVVTGGTAASLGKTYGLRMTIAGKTGTTQSNTDAWFVGFTPELLGIVWVGCDEPSSRFATTASGQGAVAAMPIWGKFFSKAYSDRTLKLDRKASFKTPEGYTSDSTGVLRSIFADTAIVSESAEDIVGF
jgi:penicillin-binding protein 1A